MYIYTPLCRYWIALYRYVLVFIVPHVDIELEDNKQFISNIPRRYIGENKPPHPPPPPPGGHFFIEIGWADSDEKFFLKFSI